MINYILLTLGALCTLLLFSGNSEARYKIAVVDSGFNQLSLFTDRVPLCRDGHYNFFTKRNDLGFDEIGHGTAVTKLIDDNAGSDNRDKRCFMVYKVFGTGMTNDRMIAKAILLATKRGAKVINLSLGGRGYGYDIVKAVRYAATQGVRVFVAAGNEALNLNESCDVYPACIKQKNVIVVGALDVYGRVAEYSNIGMHIKRWELGDAFGMQGTSFASPRAAGKYVRQLGK